MGVKKRTMNFFVCVCVLEYIIWHGNVILHITVPQRNSSANNSLPKIGIGDRDRGGQNVPNARGGGELAPKVVLGKLGLLTPKSRIFYRISVEKRVQFRDPRKNSKFSPPSNFFRRFDPPPPIPVSNGNALAQGPLYRSRDLGFCLLSLAGLVLT